MNERALADRLEAALGTRPVGLRPLSGGCVADIRRVDFPGGERVVAKMGGDLGTEAYMLRYLARHSALPVPAVVHEDGDLLVIEFVETSGPLDTRAEHHAARLLAALHEVGGEAFGHERDTLIGSLAQPNPPTGSWIEFFRDHRLMHMGREAFRAGRLDSATLERIEALAARLETWLCEPACPALIHGDMWGGNILVRDGRVAAFIDPAIYHADPEIELAFATLFGTFGRDFFAAYGEIRPIAAGFFEERRDLYNLYPLLVHARLFGGDYAGAVARTLDRFGV